jgi:hypothetical protein
MYRGCNKGQGVVIYKQSLPILQRNCVNHGLLRLDPPVLERGTADGTRIGVDLDSGRVSPFFTFAPWSASFSLFACFSIFIVYII